MEEKRANRTLLALGLALAALVALSFTLGRYGLGLGELWRVLTGTPLGLPASQMTPQQTVVWNIRLPRILLCCLVGACLASAGACYQGVFQNAMASPDLLGCSQGAAFGAALAILLGASTAGITASAFLFSLVTVALVYLIGQYAPGQKVLNLVRGPPLSSWWPTRETSCPPSLTGSWALWPGPGWRPYCWLWCPCCWALCPCSCCAGRSTCW